MVDVSVFLQGRFEQDYVIGVLARVAFLEVDCLGGCCFDDLFSSGGVDVAEDDIGTFRVEELDGRCADAVRAAGENDDFAIQTIKPSWIWLKASLG